MIFVKIELVMDVNDWIVIKEWFLMEKSKQT